MTTTGPTRALADPGDRSPTAGELGMWVFLAGEVLFFGALLVGYAATRLHAPEAFAAASAHTSLLLGSANTAVLLTSSAAIALALDALHAARPAVASRWLLVTLALGAVFIGIKGIEYHEEWQRGLFPGPRFGLDGAAAPVGAETFFAWYFIATALHALHLTIGLAVGAVLWRSKRLDVERIAPFALYWHFVDVVWVLLYPLIYLVAPRA